MLEDGKPNLGRVDVAAFKGAEFRNHHQNIPAINPECEAEVFALHRYNTPIEQPMEDNRRTFRGLTVIGPNGPVWLDVLYTLLNDQSPHALEAELNRIGVQRDLRDGVTDKELEGVARRKRMHRQRLARPPWNVRKWAFAAP